MSIEGNMDPKKAMSLFTKTYSMFTNNGYVPVNDSITGLSDEPMEIKDVLVSTDLVRFT